VETEMQDEETMVLGRKTNIQKDKEMWAILMALEKSVPALGNNHMGISRERSKSPENGK
jgi:hypothetical protein